MRRASARSRLERGNKKTKAPPGAGLRALAAGAGVNENGRAVFGKVSGIGSAHAAGGTSDEGKFVFKWQVHGLSLVSGESIKCCAARFPRSSAA